MKDWIDSPVSNMRQRIEEDYWCRHCKARYVVVQRLENEVGEYDGDETCLLCGHEGVLASEVEDNIIE